MFSLSSTPLDIDFLKQELTRPEAGACVTFEGWVRNRNEGRAVTQLEYEAYAPMAVKEGERILEEARTRFGVLEIYCAHRVGLLAIGDLAVWVGVAAGHRDAAYSASRYIIDEIKARVPIWKKEFYEDGDSGWVNAERAASGDGMGPEEPAPPFTESEYYARQIRLPDVGAAGQKKLRDSRVLIIGAGGLGSPALSYLAAAGVGTIGICEGDTLEASNLHRQTLYHYAAVGQKKAELAAKRLREQNPFIDIRIHGEGLTPENAMAIFGEYDLILDCTDNFAAKFLINDAAVLRGKPALFASIYQYEGQLLFVRPDAEGPCLRCLWPEVPEAGCVGSCAEAGVLGAVPGVFGAMQAVEAIKHLVGLPHVLGQELVIFDCLTYTSQRVRTPKQRQCPVCGDSPRIRSIVRDEYLPPDDLEIDVSGMDSQHLAKYRVIDIRELEEVAAQPLEGVEFEHIAMSTWDPERLPIAADEPCLLSCASGMRSARLAERLREMGYSNVYSAKDGWHAFHMRTMR